MPDPNPNPPPIPLLSRPAARAKADAVFRRIFADLAELGVQAVAMTADARAALQAGRPLTADHLAALDAARPLEAEFVRVGASVAVPWAILSGRWPEEREAEAYAACADPGGLSAFIARMERVPVGFCDPPEGAAPAQ